MVVHLEIALVVVIVDHEGAYGAAGFIGDISVVLGNLFVLTLDFPLDFLDELAAVDLLL